YYGSTILLHHKKLLLSTTIIRTVLRTFLRIFLTSIRTRRILITCLRWILPSHQPDTTVIKAPALRTSILASKTLSGFKYIHPKSGAAISKEKLSAAKQALAFV